MRRPRLRLRTAAILACLAPGLLPGTQALADENAIRCGAAGAPDAIAACTRVLQRNPAPSAEVQALAYYDRAVAKKDGGDPEAARRDLDLSIQRKPTASALFLRGVIAMDAHQVDRALADYDAALRLDPRNVAVMVDKAIVLDGNGQTDEAAATLDGALKIEPGNATALNQRSLILDKLGRNREAARDRTRAAALDEVFAGYLRQNQRVVRVMVPPKAPLPFETAAVKPGSRVAMVIGNAAYAFGALANPGNDARLVAASLKSLGFEVTLEVDATRADFASALAGFAPRAAKADVAVIFYAGHGLQLAKGNTGENYLLPTDAQLDGAARIDEVAVPAGRLLDAMAGAKSRILVLDACRDNPFVEKLKAATGAGPSRSLGRGLARIIPEDGDAMQGGVSGTLVVFSTAANQVAFDDSRGSRDSPFSAAFAKYLRWPGLEIKSVIVNVARDVVNVSGKRQTPFMSSSLLDEIYLAGR